MKLKDILNEKITIDVEIGDTILTGKFKNKKTKVASIGTDDHGMPIINGRKATTFRMMKKVDENKEDIKTIHKILTMYGRPAKRASDMIKKYYKKAVKQFKGDSQRDLAMAIIGYDMIRENKDLFKMYEGLQKDKNNMALYIIDLNKELSNAKVLAKKHPKYKKYIKFIQQDIKDAEKKLAKLKSVKESITQKITELLTNVNN